MRVGRRLSLGVWVAATVLGIVWGVSRTTRVEAPAVGYALSHDISTIEVGRLSEVGVTLHELVDVGTVVARIDARGLERERDIVAAELLAVQDQMATDAATDARRFAQGLEEARLTEAELRVALQEDRALRDALASRIEQVRSLVENNAGSSWELEDLQREKHVLDERIRQQTELLEVASQAADRAEERDASRPRDSRWELVAAERRVQELEHRIGQTALSSAISGQVTQVWVNPGDVVQPGEPIVTVKPTQATFAVAYLPPPSVVGLERGREAMVVRPTGEVLRGQIASVGASTEQLPPQLWQNSAAPEWGVPVKVELDGAVAPDEPLKVRL